MPRQDNAEREKWQASRRTELRYGAALRRLARQIGDLIRGHSSDPDQLSELLDRYALAIKPWASAVTTRMLNEVNLRDARTWENHAKQMGYALRREIKHAPTGAVMRQLHEAEVDLITSLPRDAALNVQEKARETLYTGARFEQWASQIEGVSRSRATLIARTETAKASSAITQARAEFVGSDGYIWRTAKDSDVRSTHRKMEGKYIRWDSPPVVDEGVAPYHAGRIYNCRCYPEPIVPRFRAEAV